MYSLSITISDYDFDSPQEAAEAMLKWLREDRTTVFVMVRDELTGEETLVKVEGESK